MNTKISKLSRCFSTVSIGNMYLSNFFNLCNLKYKYQLYLLILWYQDIIKIEKIHDTASLNDIYFCNTWNDVKFTAIKFSKYEIKKFNYQNEWIHYG